MLPQNLLCLVLAAIAAEEPNATQAGKLVVDQSSIA